MKLRVKADKFAKNYPEEYEYAQELSEFLFELQKKLLAKFPECYKQLPDSLEQYLQLRSVFACIEALWVKSIKRYIKRLRCHASRCLMPYMI